MKDGSDAMIRACIAVWAGFVKWSPFAYELYFPVQVFMERIRGEALATGLAIQAGWAVIAWFVAMGLWRLGIRRYQAVGG